MSINAMLQEQRSRRTAMWRGARCPACGDKSLFARHLENTRGLLFFAVCIWGDIRPMMHHPISPFSLSDTLSCRSPYGRAGLYAAFMCIFIIFTVLSIIVAMLSLPIVKGAVVGLQWALHMHGFAPQNDPVEKELSMWIRTHKSANTARHRRPGRVSRRQCESRATARCRHTDCGAPRKQATENPDG